MEQGGGRLGLLDRIGEHARERKHRLEFGRDRADIGNSGDMDQFGDLLEANHWELADKYLTAQYIQHNPNVASGRDGVVKYFTAARKPSPIPDKMKTKIVAVVAEGDLVIVATPLELTSPKDPSKKYTTTWFDMWRFKDGKADEHWDGATITAPPPGAAAR